VINHIDLGRTIKERRKAVGFLIRNGDITFGGYKKAKIYGLLICSSGKRMKVENRVFFKDEAEALINGYRPCGHCMKEKYEQWKKKTTVMGSEKDYLLIPK
jgi:methylphosphotriester-DNA--protein-cysteine methyltransferase